MSDEPKSALELVMERLRKKDEDSGVTGRAGAPDSLLGRAVDPVEAFRALRAAVPTSGGLGRVLPQRSG